MRRLVPLLALALAPCPALAKPKLPPPARYVCEDGTRLAVAFSTPGPTPGTAVLRILGTGTEVKLAQAPAADGGRYTAAATEFWDHGQTATFTRDGKALTCRVKR